MGKSNDLDGLNVDDEIDPDDPASEEESEDSDAPGEDEDRGDEVHPEDGDDEALNAVAGEDDDDTGGKKKGSAVVSHGRFNEVNEAYKKERDTRLHLEEEVARLRGAAGKLAKEVQEPAIDLKALRKQKLDAMMEGDADKALELEEKIEAEIRRAATEEAEARAVLRITQTTQKAEFDRAVVEVVGKHPFLNSEGADADPEAINEVVEWRDFYIMKGMTTADALRKAADRVAKSRGTKEPDGDGDDEEEALAEKKSAKTIAQLRKAQALKRNAASAQQQPSSMQAGTGNRGDVAKLNIEDLDEDEFNSLSEKQKAKMRGDFVT